MQPKCPFNFELQFQYIQIDKIPLRVHSQRGHRNDMDDYHPSKLLQSDEACYFSQINDDFEKDEPDWIIFEYDQLYMPKQITIRNLEDKRGLKTFRVFIGDGNEWHMFAPKEIDAKINYPDNDPQTFTIGEIDHKLIGKQQFKQIKVEFMENHGETNRSWSRFAIKEIQLFGVAY